MVVDLDVHRDVAVGDSGVHDDRFTGSGNERSGFLRHVGLLVRLHEKELVVVDIGPLGAVPSDQSHRAVPSLVVLWR
ncbi:hypothetical protein [Actinomadura violacea]|uniref:Uncharacterized protein n=1 Tax=Actinomadura violacea TaxID=2819934 RepID=A0ABS3RPH2_9ACTN|nr:hypothetical protein [Actinomadura violacea]MBO2458213.1 hypothetical protein [Actinomadura violacea]